MARTKAQVAADNKRTAAEKKRKEIAALEDSPAKEKDKAKKRKIKMMIKIMKMKKLKIQKSSLVMILN